MKWYEDKEYREMCEGAEEIQKQQAPEDSVIVDQNGKLIWLPSQEDLQEMVIRFRSPASFWQIHFAFNYWLCETFSIGHPAVFGLDTAKVKRAGFTSLNQLWLAFVMHELYQKKWDPETKKWKKSKRQN